jgi:hypothetical protein
VPQKLDASSARFDEHYRAVEQDSSDETRKPGSAAYI